MSRKRVIDLVRYRTALAAGNATSVWLGTSTVQGANATEIDRRFHQVISNRLARAYGSSKVVRYYSPQADLSASLESYFTYVDGSGSHVLVSEGLALRTVTLTNGAAITITVSASAISALFVSGSSYGQGTVDIDGSSSQWPASVASGDDHSAHYDVEGLSHTTHTVTITAPVSGSIKFTGLVAHDYPSAVLSSGIRTFNSGHGSFSSSNFVNQTKLYDRIRSLSPNLIVLMFGTNDYGGDMPLATYESNLNAIVGHCMTSTSADVLIVTPYKRFDVVGALPWSGYQSINASVAAARGCGYVDLTDYYPGSQAGDFLNLIDSDDLHQTDFGHSQMAGLVYPCLI